MLQAHGRQTGFLQKCVNISVCQSYCGVWFVSFTLFPEFPAFASRNFSRYLEIFVPEDAYLCVVFIQESLDTSREGGHCVRFLFWNVLFSLQLYENYTAACLALLGGFPGLLVFWPHPFRNLWNTFISWVVFFTVFACCWLVINFLISWFESSDFLSVASLWAGNCSIRRPKAHRDNRTHCGNVRFRSFLWKHFLATNK